MKYVLLFCGTDADAAAFNALSPDELRHHYAEVGTWFQQHQTRIVDSAQLQPPQTATTVRAYAAEQRALELTANRAEQSLLRRRLRDRAC